MDLQRFTEQELNASYSALQGLQDRVLALVAMVEHRQNAFDAANDAYQRGIVTLPRLMDVRRELDAAMLAEQRAWFEQAQHVQTLKWLAADI